MYIHNIDPVLFEIGFLEIRYYGLVYLLGVLILYYYLKKNKDKLGLSEDNIYNFIFYSFLGIIIGARLFEFMFSEPDVLLADPLELFRIWHGGMSFFGGLVGVLISGYYFCKRYKLDFYKLADVAVFPATIALIFGRIANFINGEIVGTISELPWCVVFNGYLGCRHPYQIYASLSHLWLLLILFKARNLKYKKNLENGILFVTFIICYSLIRFLVDFLREEPRILGLTIWQILSLIFIIAGLIFYKKIKLKIKYQ